MTIRSDPCRGVRDQLVTSPTRLGLRTARRGRCLEVVGADWVQDEPGAGQRAVYGLGHQDLARVRRRLHPLGDVDGEAHDIAWTQNGQNLGSVEATAMSGMLASRTISGPPVKVARGGELF